jgi:hypothetical protein
MINHWYYAFTGFYAFAGLASEPRFEQKRRILQQSLLVEKL